VSPEPRGTSNKKHFTIFKNLLGVLDKAAVQLCETVVKSFDVQLRHDDDDAFFYGSVACGPWWIF
jgi:hypothetical protein